MKLSGFKLLFAVIVFSMAAQTYGQDCIALHEPAKSIKYRSAWDRVLPRYVKLQYAGGMGLFAVGPGWDYGKKKQWESDFLVGWIPRYTSDHSKIVLTLKQNYIPWTVSLNDNFVLRPLHTGLYLNSTLGSDYWLKEPDRYPDSYYGFSTKLRINVFIGQQLTYKIPAGNRLQGKTVTFYYEISSNDLYIVSAATNSYLKPNDYLKLSLGIKIQLEN
jgi:hypothetical protein